MTRRTPRRQSQFARNRPYSAKSDDRTRRDSSAAGGDARARRTDVGNAAPLPRRHRESNNLTVGVDVASVDEVASAVRRFGDRYVNRVFTPHETAYCRAARGAAAAARFAARFAAKEATAKALQPEHPWSDWRAIEVLRRKSGRCSLVLHGRAAVLAARRGIKHLALSMTHDGNQAAAIVVALRTTATNRER
jgi:holo-[acyl-carrier protein] synthase